MKLHKISLFIAFVALCITKIQAGETNPFSPKNNPLGRAPAVITQSPFTKVNPFAPESPTTTADAIEPEHQPANLDDQTIALAKANEDHASNPFAPENHATRENQATAVHATVLEHHQAIQHSPLIHEGHVSTAEHTASIKTLDITPGHSATLEPIAINHGVETERYFIQDKKYESYLSSHIDPTKRTYTVTIPATVHVGSFTVFKVQGIHGTPDHLQPAYHVEIQGNMHELVSSTQYTEVQGSAVEKLTQLEDKYLTGIQTQFKAFTKEVRELISTEHQNGESLEAAKLHATQIVATKKPLKLIIGESQVAASFTGGSAQSSNPAIVSAILKFDGTKTDPKWKLVLTAHKAGEAIVTYSSGSESNLQPVIVVEKSSIQGISENKEEAPIGLKDSANHTAKTRAFSAPNDADEEESEEKNYKKSEITTSTLKKEESEEENSDEKTARKFANEDEPFSSFLKEAPEEEAASNDEESSDPSASQSESIESATQVKATTDADDTDEEPTQDQEEDK